MAPWGIARRLFAVDVLTMAFVTALGAGTMAVAARVPAWPEVVTACALIAMGVPFVAWLRTHLDLAIVRFVHDWALAFVIWVVYREVLLVAGPAHGGRVYDAWLIAADRWLFRTDPTAWLERIAFPALTEVLQIAYALFYALPLVVGAELYRRGAEARFHRWAFICGIGFFLTYAGYLTLPAVGPSFTIHAVSQIATDRPGLWLTPFLRQVIDAGSMVPHGVPAALALQLAARDAFPSGHTIVTLLAIWWSWRERLRVRWLVSVVGTLLIVATIYLRCHYVVDVIAGGLLATLVMAAGPALHRRVAEQLGTWDADLSPDFRRRV